VRILNCAFAMVAGLLLVACGDEEVEIQYDLATPVQVDVFTQSHYSTYDGDEEKVGTITSAYYTLTYGMENGKHILQRQFQSNASKGYLKNSHPGELLWRVPSVKLIANGIRVESVQGYELFDSLVVRKLSVPEAWKRQLANPAYIKDLDRNEKHRWEMGHLLAGPVPSKANITELLRGRGRLDFALILIDSVVTEGFRNLDKRRCLVYSVYLQEREPFPYYIWEQHVASIPSAAKYKTYPPGPATYQTQYWMAIDPTNGIPCQEREVKRGVHTMKHPESGDTASFVSQTSMERLFTVKK
jgi:hypothetical protein